MHPAEGNYLSMFNAIARLRPGGTVAQAASEGTARGRFVADTGTTTMAIFGGNGPVAISATSLKDALTADIRQPLVVLLAAVVLLLLTATANVAGLHLARAETRRREMAIRAALGAGSARVIRQLLAESLLLGATGSAAGVLLAWLLHQLLPAVLPVDFPRADGITFDATVILFTVMLSVVASMVFGLLPAVRVRRLDLVAALNEDGTAPIGASHVNWGGRARIVIMVGQVAIGGVCSSARRSSDAAFSCCSMRIVATTRPDSYRRVLLPASMYSANAGTKSFMPSSIGLRRFPQSRTRRSPRNFR